MNQMMENTHRKPSKLRRKLKFRWIRLSFEKEGSMSETHSSGPPQETECRGLTPRPDSQNEVCMYRGTAQVYETTSCNLRFPEIMKTRLVHKFTSMPQAMKIPDAKAAVDKGWKKVETILAWQLGKVKSKKDDFQEAQRDEKKVHFATLMNICHLKNAALQLQFQKCQGRVVLRGDVFLFPPSSPCTPTTLTP